MYDTSWLKKYALSYLSKYNSTTNNLIRILNNKLQRSKIEKNKKLFLKKSINNIIEELESRKILNDDIYTINKIESLYLQGKSEFFIISILQKKGIDKLTAKEKIIEFEKNNPDWQIKAAKIFAKKKKIGKSGVVKNKNKDIAKMARAGFNYNLIKKILEYE